MTPANSHDFAEQNHDQSESIAPRMQRINRKTQPLRGKYVKKRSAVRRGIMQRRRREIQW